MDYRQLKEDVCWANKELAKKNLVVLTWGNASGVDRVAGVMAIKPSGVDYARLVPEDIVVINLNTGAIVEGTLSPSMDTPTHLHLYRNFESIGGIVHMHSHYATGWAQAGKEIPCLGTTHADHFYGPIPVTRQLTPGEIDKGYESETGNLVIETFKKKNLDPNHMPAILVQGHAPFVWGIDIKKAFENAVVIEEVAKMAYTTLTINPQSESLPQYLLDKHFLRKHGPKAYYGQKNKS